jgi:hypothetical protein
MCTASYNMKLFTTEYIYVFRVFLQINSDYFSTQQ